MLLVSFFPYDDRVEKEARTLLQAGHNVFLLSLGKRGAPVREEIKGIKVIRVLPSKAFLNRLWNYFCFQLFFIHPFWAKALADTVKQYGIEALHVHDLLMVKTGLYVANKYNIPLIADLHENYPEGMKAWGEKKTWRRKILDMPAPLWRWKRLERLCVKRANKIITVVEEAKNHYVRDCRIPPEKITVMMNTMDLETFDDAEIKSVCNNYKDNFIISYIGCFGPHRGIDTSIKAMPKILEKIPNAKLLLVGGGLKGYEEEIKKLCKDLKVENNVIFTGWVNFNSIPSYISVSDVGLVPHHKSGHTDTTIPNKLFQYMTMRKPVVVTDAKPLRRIVEETKCGIVVPSGDYNKMANAVVKLYEDKDYAKKLGENGRRAVERKYNWEKEAEKLCELYEKLREGYA
ncbi:MAG: glycosyltransferase WbuB [Candidatus Altiarchaeales archaeon]|nr:MAG: glycosyltransferase WbuB [Candidatus Altiarchaeales archaeon]